MCEVSMLRKTKAFLLPPLAAALALTACGRKPSTQTPAAGVPAAATAPSAADRAAVARTMARAAMIKPGDRVLVSGSVRDADLLEDLAVETMKLGGQPVISIWSDRLTRRSYDDVPASFDSAAPTLWLALANSFDVQLSVDVAESDSVMTGVPAARMAARSKAGDPANKAWYRRNIRQVNLGNGLYPTATLAARLGMAQADLASAFWHAAGMPAESIRARGAAAYAALKAGRQITITAPNGTNLTFTGIGAKAALSDGALTPEKVRQGGFAVYTFLPAGELNVPAVAGSADGKLVIDKVTVMGTDVVGLTLVFSHGRMASMTAQSGLDPLKAAYDAAGGAKDQLSGIDLGLNPEIKLPLTTGRIVWMAAGALTVGVGDNQVLGGTNVSDFGFNGAISGATLTVDGKTVIDHGVLK
jgi:leucyl aminopeptidase (aminopeptidase T)